jgi:hypothetical protein
MTKSIELPLALALVLIGSPALAQRGGGGNVSRGAARSSVNAGAGANRAGNVNATRNVDQNVNVNRDINVNRDVDVHGGYYGGGGGCCYHPVATAAAVTATAAVTAAAIGSIVNTVPPSCTPVVVSQITYQQCGSTWYQPQFSGTSTTYVVVNSPK